jgi:hypothetical protein
MLLSSFRQHIISKEILLQKIIRKPCMVVHAWNPSTQEVEAVGLQFQGQFRLHRKTLSQQNLSNTVCGGSHL